ncbi:hypothetical protein J437_LFUL006068 [Ladona fulva]|uniref:Uncharacterized protein n=1 Tax=Ladona fulva TaxID=123851 RepID=A0A8K0NZF4_LADFU|nr:hypothetical protein J437_LFUL006068 [Ladona fulva]
MIRNINGRNTKPMARVRIINNKWQKASISSALLLSLLFVNSVEICLGDDALQPVNAPLFTSIFKQSQEAEFEYQGQARSERDLDTCVTDGSESAPVCSIVYKRFWQPALVYRLCRCPERQECPWILSHPLNNINLTAIVSSEFDIDGESPSIIKIMNHTRDRTMSLNSRAQLKLCRNVRKMPTCPARATAMKIHSRVIPENISGTTRIPGPRLFPNNQTSMHVSVSCKCPQARYWRYQRTIANNYGNETDGIIDMYACAPLKKCKPMEFCGHFTSDFATYYQCSCPKGYLCLAKQPRERINSSELMYNGTVYKAICTPTSIIT